MSENKQSAFTHITSEYKKLFTSFATIFILLLICIALGTVIVFPLWNFAISHSRLYTIVCLCAALCLCIGKIVSGVKKSGLKKSVSLLLRIAAIVLAVAASFKLVLAGHKTAALLVFIAFIILYGFLRILLQNKKNASDE